ncbi:glycosyltransferase family 61 protein [Gluconobacter oxydans]|nr:glycosyltransferase family 61 protein [Gluconobacter oxydans]
MALDRGYEIIHPEKFSLEEQIRIFSEAAAVVGEHGSGMHSTLFSSPGTVVGCLGFWNAVQLHIGYLMGHQNVYVTRNCKWPTPENNQYRIECTEEDLKSFFEKVDSLIQWPYRNPTGPVAGFPHKKNGACLSRPRSVSCGPVTGRKTCPQLDGAASVGAASVAAEVFLWCLCLWWCFLPLS